MDKSRTTEMNGYRNAEATRRGWMIVGRGIIRSGMVDSTNVYMPGRAVSIAPS